MSTEELPFDIDEMRQKYNDERDRRIRPDAEHQYPTEVNDEYFRDPAASDVIERGPLTDEVDAIVIGAGMGGLTMAVKLKLAGYANVRMIDAAGDVGGTWYWNRYPGAQCDVESYLYLPLLDETGYIPTRKYAYQPEIFSYFQSTADKYGLYEDAVFQTSVTSAKWDEVAQRWRVLTNRGDDMTCRFLVLANGFLSKLKLPGVPGIDDFGGKVFHTSRWDYSYTGGGPTGGLDGLKDKRVAVIGTGATGIQCVPYIAADAEQLYVVQRTPSSVSERLDKETDPDWAAQLKTGWQQERMDNFLAVTNGGQFEEDMVNDSWTDLFVRLSVFAGPGGDDPVEGSVDPDFDPTEIPDMLTMDEIRQRVASTVSDEATANALMPYYRLWCKRPCFNDEYLPAFNRSNVTLVDTEGQGVERFTETGFVVDGKPYDVDCIIFATGFENGTNFTSRSGFDIEGQHGQKLSEKWANGLRTLHGMMTHGFPNFFTVGLTQTGVTPNTNHIYAEQTEHIVGVLNHLEKTNSAIIEPSVEAEDAWVQEFYDGSGPLAAFFANCTPGYYNSEGRGDNPNVQTAAVYPGGILAFFDVLQNVRDNDFEGIEFR